jgi:hypothetical protein
MQLYNKMYDYIINKKMYDYTAEMDVDYYVGENAVCVIGLINPNEAYNMAPVWSDGIRQIQQQQSLPFS